MISFLEILPYIYLAYMFLSIYLLLFFLLLFFFNRKNLFDVPEIRKKYSVSVLIPAYNEEKTISDTIEKVFLSDYSLKEVIVLNDGSTDNTKKIVQGLMKKYPCLKIVNKKNTGKADSLNEGIKIAKGELIAVVDADSYPEKDALKNLIGFFSDSRVGAATPFISPRNKNSFLEKFQVAEYSVIAFTRKLLNYVDAIYVSPGPLALYRKSALEKIGGFDTTNMTEDIEVTWNLAKEGYKREMCLCAKATTIVPKKFIDWYKQRRRWTIGGIQCIAKYKKYFFRKGIFGFFIVPFFIVQLFLGLLGLSIFFYLLIRNITLKYLFTSYAVQSNVHLLAIEDFYITPSFLNYLGIILFAFGAFFTFLVLAIMKESILKKQNIFNIAVYLLFYLTLYPFILMPSLYNYFRKKWTW